MRFLQGRARSHHAMISSWPCRVETRSDNRWMYFALRQRSFLLNHPSSARNAAALSRVMLQNIASRRSCFVVRGIAPANSTECASAFPKGCGGGRPLTQLTSVNSLEASSAWTPSLGLSHLASRFWSSAFCAAPNCEQGPMESSCTGTRRRPAGMSRMNVQYLEAETQGVIRAPATPARNACNGLVILAQSAGPHGCSLMDLMQSLAADTQSTSLSRSRKEVIDQVCKLHGD